MKEMSNLQKIALKRRLLSWADSLRDASVQIRRTKIEMILYDMKIYLEDLCQYDDIDTLLDEVNNLSDSFGLDYLSYARNIAAFVATVRDYAATLI